MIRFSGRAYGPLALACVSAAILAGGCWGRKKAGPDAKEKAPVAAQQKAPPVPENFSVVEKGQQPAGKQPVQPGEYGQLLADIACGDMVKSWQAEERMRAAGSSAAAAARTLFSSGSPEARAAGCRLAYHYKDTTAIPGMIALLGDDSRLVRSEANVHLCGLTGQDFGFRPDALEADRAAAQGRWRDWCSRTYGTPQPGAGKRR